MASTGALTSAPRSKRVDRRGLEVRAFERDRAGTAGDLRVGPSHHPGHGLRTLRVGDDEHVGIELARDAVERRDRFAAYRPADPQLVAGKRREIERMHGMPELDQHVVRDIDNRADRPDPGCL
jgi:hypothetical protein